MPATSLKTRKRDYIKSSSFFMAMLFTILCGAAALSLGYFINYFTKGHFVESTKQALHAEIKFIQTLDYQDIREKADQVVYIPLGSSGDIPFDTKIGRLSEGIITFTHPTNNRIYAAKIHTFPEGQKTLIGHDITRISSDFQFMQIIGFISILFIMTVVFISYGISIFVVSGTNKIAATAYDIIETGDLTRRVDVQSRWDDLSNMAAVLNVLLDRIEELMDGVKQVSDNIAHDLRTPLTRLRNNIDDLAKESDTPHYHQLSDEMDHILKTFNALLRISRIETEKQKTSFKTLNLKDILGDVIEFYEPLAEGKNISIETDLNDSQFLGDQDLLFQAYANVIDNAIKYTPQDGKITLQLFDTQHDIHIIIGDSGQGVSECEKEKIFKRFFRCDSSRHERGTGLGLSLVKAVIELHNGSITAQNKNGLEITTIFKRA